MKYYLVWDTVKGKAKEVNEITFFRALIEQTLDLTVVPSKNDANTVNFFDCGVIFGYSVREIEEEWINIAEAILEEEE